jgi:CRISPR-associated protein Cas2
MQQMNCDRDEFTHYFGLDRQFIKLQSELRNIIDPDVDSLRFYNLGNRYLGKVVHIGSKPSINIEGDLIV